MGTIKAQNINMLINAEKNFHNLFIDSSSYVFQFFLLKVLQKYNDSFTLKFIVDFVVIVGGGQSDSP